MRVLIIGCGYVGLPLGDELIRAGHEVWGLRRTPPPMDPSTHEASTGVQYVAADITRPEDLRSLPNPFDWVVDCVASSHGGVEDYRRVYVDGARNIIEWLAARPPRKLVYTSSTGVYGQTDGSRVSETSPTEPLTATGQVLVEAERLWVEAALSKQIPAVILRVAGIYGPNRTHFLREYLRNEARIAGQGERLMNMIHLRDVIGCVIAALQNGRPGEIYNAVDDEPVAHIHFYRWLSETLGKWMPPFAPPDTDERRKRGATNKRVSNRRLKTELGYTFKYPTFRQGYTAEIQRLDAAGEIPSAPEPR